MLEFLLSRPVSQNVNDAHVVQLCAVSALHAAEVSAPERPFEVCSSSSGTNNKTRISPQLRAKLTQKSPKKRKSNAHQSRHR